jgi:Ribonuclease HepT-like
MARPTLADRGQHILDAIAKIEIYTAGRTLDDSLGDDMRRHAVERCLEIISEASRRRSPFSPVTSTRCGSRKRASPRSVSTRLRANWCSSTSTS